MAKMLIRWLVNTAIADDDGYVHRRVVGDEDIIDEAPAREYITTRMAARVAVDDALGRIGTHESHITGDSAASAS